MKNNTDKKFEGVIVALKSGEKILIQGAQSWQTERGGRLFVYNDKGLCGTFSD